MFTAGSNKSLVSFFVKAAKNAETIEVAVRTGKVSVYEDAPNYG
jgi:hypothetical protein